MNFRDWATRVTLIFLMLAALILALLAGKSTQLQQNTATPSNSDIATWRQYPQIQIQSGINQGSKAQDIGNFPVITNQSSDRYITTQAFAEYKPKLEIAAVHPSNYGERYAQDINGLPIKNQPIIVLHETSNSATSAVNFFQTPHTDENVQASYHAIIKLDGTVLYLVPPEKRAFGAANSVFDGADGIETVQTNPKLPPSVNNFAYHVSLETPPDGRGNNFLKSHSGYTPEQYNSLAWLIAQSQVPEDRITTHKAVDRSSQRVDPLSFDFDKFLELLNTYRQVSPVYRAQK
ncbi:AmpD [Trichormus variabilis ATCC 29413]|uniref:N-acetylmuramoyl-L-alanine amidase n=2 Tax=Anabaena variabilis TaxID=264691 RepID=Q3M3A0_TRIV2|nr:MULTISPECIES: peptidoglycan recognition family protein [Nostocaceae]ABA24536.1 AmpD [Trichormus variabilis ATCC 29413]MBC1212864.1 N-acetylmuramoyl-L-alanine amidase [Trichormus variabilis ARAD]MBC1257023.1 N-acetylmuramoyl-L-alanine amidase [Trichormus variabilis V5]MBC1266041.1 N-acetylmuramoyl-L-alanine amidase [Trichormus variabilis FSR]MBC1301310.1 N-acetylmuramoyl-L-alanine amidase [Trichormus variabilis N2B]